MTTQNGWKTGGWGTLLSEEIVEEANEVGSVVNTKRSVNSLDVPPHSLMRTTSLVCNLFKALSLEQP